MSPSKILFCFSTSFIAGILIPSSFGIHLASPSLIGLISMISLLMIGLFIIIVTLLLKGNEHFAVLGFCLIFFTLGIVRFQFAELSIKNDQLRQLNDSNQKVTIQGVVNDEPDVRDTYQNLEIKVTTGSTILVSTDLRHEYHYLDPIKLMGKLTTPTNFADFNYQEYLLKDGIYSVMQFPKIEIAKEQHHQYTISSYFYEKILFLKGKLKESILQNFSGSERLVMQGIILGDNKNMTQDLRDKLNGTGLRYLTAISGLHVIIVSEIILFLLLIIGLGRIRAVYVSIFLIWLYVALTGFSASGIRAATMGTIMLFAQAVGRQNTSARTITLAGALMLLQNPLLARFDVGFQLSFLASLGIIHGKPIIENWLKQMMKSIPQQLEKSKNTFLIWVHDRLDYIIGIISVTLVAQLFTMPIMIYNFKNLSLIAPITNILIVPIFYWLMLFGFMAAFLGIFLPFLGWVCALPCYLILFYFLKVMETFYQPWAVKPIENISFVWFFVYYALLFSAVFYFTRKQKPIFLQ